MPKGNLKDYFTHAMPFGPTITNQIADAKIFEALFYKENLLYNELSKHPSIIVGRRGTGKTAFLRSILLGPTYKIVVELPPAPVFRQIIDSINVISTGIPFVEEVAQFWEVVLWIPLLFKLVEVEKEPTSLDKVQRYLLGMGIKGKKNPYQIIRTAIEVFKEHGGGKPIGIISDLIDKIAFENITFSEARDTALEYMEDMKIRAIILLDSLEEFPLDQNTMAYAISGLLKCQGDFRQPGAPHEIRCCLPAELYHRFMTLSSNPNKDFQQRLLLHWHAGELLRLASRRYLTYLQLHEPAAHKKFERLDLDKRADAQSFFDALFPVTMSNSLGSPETSMAYVLRHTQLTPRHFLMYLNEICIKNKRRGGEPTKIREDAIIEAVRATEEIICAEILRAFKFVHAGAAAACKQCIPYLPLSFSVGELHHVYNIHGKGIPGVYEFDDLLNMLIEIGAVGKVTGETNRYILGTFEYTAQHHLITSTDDDLCLHPVFTEVFSAKKPKPGPSARVVYPFGTDIDTQEYREV